MSSPPPGLSLTPTVRFHPAHLFLDKLLSLVGQHVDQVELRRHRPSEGVDVPDVRLQEERTEGTQLDYSVSAYSYLFKPTGRSPTLL